MELRNVVECTDTLNDKSLYVVLRVVNVLCRFHCLLNEIKN